jgi:tRNA (guanine-N7-)-methyltransferase
MKPEDLKSPFTWDKRYILVQDRVWYVPEQFEDFTSFSFPGWSHPQLFEQARPICLEYCSGNGAWIVAKAQAYPEYNWVAIERKFSRVRKIWSKVKNCSIANLLAVCGEGHCITQQYIPSSSVQAVYINFPDPWPKKRHAKHRLIQVSFVEEIHRILQPGGVLTMVTDDESYSAIIIHILQQIVGFESLFANPYYVMDYPDYGTSYFEDLWRQKGKAIRYHAFRKTDLKMENKDTN